MDVFEPLHKNNPPPVANPANQLGSSIFCACSVTIYLFILITSEKADFSSGDKPKFIEALMATNSDKPACVRCSLFIIIWYAWLKRL